MQFWSSQDNYFVHTAVAMVDEEKKQFPGPHGPKLIYTQQQIRLSVNQFGFHDVPESQRASYALKVLYFGINYGFHFMKGVS